ncbi:MAG TPA: hypothetical protein VGC15_05505 [Acetobacteraceae bacterium]
MILLVQVLETALFVWLIRRTYLPTGSGEATGAGAIAARYNEDLRGLLKADSLVA